MLVALGGVHVGEPFSQARTIRESKLVGCCDSFARELVKVLGLQVTLLQQRHAVGNVVNPVGAANVFIEKPNMLNHVVSNEHVVR